MAASLPRAPVGIGMTLTVGQCPQSLVHGRSIFGVELSAENTVTPYSTDETMCLPGAKTLIIAALYGSIMGDEGIAVLKKMVASHLS